MQRDIEEGMVVRSSEGEKLGTVTRCGDADFVVEKGLIFHRDFLARYDEVAELRDREVILTRAASEEVQRHRREQQGGARRGAGEEAGGSREDVVPLGTFGHPQDIVVELAAEEAIPRTLVRPAGALRVRKVVRTEMREFRIPVRREELHFERVATDRVAGESDEPASASGAGLEALRAGAPFQEQEVVIALREERVEFTKTAHVWQEVHVHKAAREELAQVRTSVRREVAEVSGSGSAEGGVPGDVPHDGPLDGLH